MMGGILVRYSVAIACIQVRSVCRSVIDSIKIADPVYWGSEILLCDEVRSRSDVLESGIFGGGAEFVVHDIGDGVV